MLNPSCLIPFGPALLFGSLLFGGPLAFGQADSPTEITDRNELVFERDIRPILKEHCLDCHGATATLEGGLDLRLRRLMEQGGESGPAIVPGESASSLIWQRIQDGEMPPGDKKVPPRQRAVLANWIDAGAPTARPEPDELPDGIGITPEERSYWFFQPITRPARPVVRDVDRVRTPIDDFILAELEPLGLTLSQDTDRKTLIVRAALDLTGLPPTAAEVTAFVEDSDPNAYERLLDRLMASPHYGERWGRHWLDVAGYADSEGYTNADADRPWAYKYRDYVIRSFDGDKPFDRFICEQLAGDELVAPPYQNLDAEQIELLVATGFLRMAADGTGSGDNGEEARNRTVADTLKIVSTSLLGLSVACAQCHDHRYDPIPQRDYYRLRSVFEPALDWKAWRTPQARRISLYTDDDREVAARVEAEAQVVVQDKQTKQEQYISDALEKELAQHDEVLRDKLRAAFRTPADQRTAEQQELLKRYPSTNITAGNLYQYNQARADELKTLDQQIAEIRSKKPVEQFVRALSEPPDHVPETYVFHRGDHRQPTDKVTPADLTITFGPAETCDIAVDDLERPSTGRRLAYAQWLTSGRHPLVARVLVNRIWLNHFGRGIVGTPGEFGKLGQQPTHPELLDWLAEEFMLNDWSLKRLHKLIMTSTVYRQSSRSNEQGLAIDAANEHWWKYPVRRLDAEIVRDRILWVNDRLVRQRFGPPAAIHPDDTGQIVVDQDYACRSIYLKVKRTQPVAVLQVFDAPVMETNCEYRPVSTGPSQSLMLMNSDFVLKQAAQFAARVMREADGKLSDRDPVPAIRRAWQLAYCRQPTAEELTEASDFVKDQVEPPLKDASKDDERLTQAIVNLCHVLFSSNEFLYVD